MVAAAAKILTAKKTHTRDGLVHAGRGQLTIHVSPNSVDRALRFMDALIKLLEQQGFSVNVTELASYLIVDGENVEMTLRETRRQESIPQGSWDRMVYHLTGKLPLEIKCRYPNEVTCSDSTLGWVKNKEQKQS